MAAKSPLYESETPGELVRVLVTSFGFLHGPAPEAHVVLDLRDALYDPHVNPALRELTGLDPEVQAAVLATEGASEVIRSTTALALALLPGHDQRHTFLRVAVGCAGGRHRSVVVANQVAGLLRSVGVGTDIEHRDITQPVVCRGRRA